MTQQATYTCKCQHPIWGTVQLYLQLTAVKDGSSPWLPAPIWETQREVPGSWIQICSTPVTDQHWKPVDISTLKTISLCNGKSNVTDIRCEIHLIKGLWLHMSHRWTLHCFKSEKVRSWSMNLAFQSIIFKLYSNFLFNICIFITPTMPHYHEKKIYGDSEINTSCWSICRIENFVI